MTPNQIQLIRRTFARVAPIKTVAALAFYKRLFELDPSLRVLFRSDIEEQATKLMQMLAAAVRLLDKPETLMPVLEDLGRRHVHYGVRDEHYDTVGQALLWMLSETIGADFSPAARDAWATLYGRLATTMKRAATSIPTPLHETMAVAQ